MASTKRTKSDLEAELAALKEQVARLAGTPDVSERDFYLAIQVDSTRDGRKPRTKRVLIPYALAAQAIGEMVGLTVDVESSIADILGGEQVNADDRWPEWAIGVVSDHTGDTERIVTLALVERP